MYACRTNASGVLSGGWQARQHPGSRSRPPHPDLESRLPAGCGAKGEDFEVRCEDGIPWRGHQGVVWFSRRFEAPPAGDGHWWRLAFQGILLRSKVWLNGVELGEREGGYTPFFLDVSRALQPGGVNTLVVRADNRLTWTSLPPRVRPAHNPVWGVYGGIYREAYLERLPDRYVGKLALRPYRDSSGAGFRADALVHARTLSDPCTLEVTLRDPSGAAVGRASAPMQAAEGAVAAKFRFPLQSVLPWMPGNPVHYALEARLRGSGGMERVVVLGGHRILSTGPGGIALDGRTLFLKGISKMEDHPELGQTQTPETMARDLDLIKEMGANFIRLAHYPHHPEEVRRARDMGLLLAGEIPYFHVGVGWSQWLVDFQSLRGFPASTFGMKQLHDRRLLLHAQRSLFELIERDGNNPAVILWSLGNETYTLNDRAGRVYGWLRDAARAFDPTRPVTLAEMTYYLPALDNRRSTARHMDLAALNMYYGWYFGKASGAADHLDDFHARHPDKSVLLSEFGAEAALGRPDSAGPRTGDRVFWARTYSESYQAELLTSHVKAAWERPFMAGVSPWCFADFYCPWFPHNPVPEYNTKGVLTRERVPKLGYHALRELYRSLPDFRNGPPAAGSVTSAVERTR